MRQRLTKQLKSISVRAEFVKIYKDRRKKMKELKKERQEDERKVGKKNVTVIKMLDFYCFFFSFFL